MNASNSSLKIEKLRFQGRWVIFRIGGCFVQALVYEEDSHYGIHGGNVSKLWIKDGEADKVVFNYDRGYDVSEPPAAGMFDFIVKELSRDGAAFKALKKAGYFG